MPRSAWRDKWHPPRKHMARRLNREALRLVTRCLRQADALKTTGKLEANWEEPYKVISVLKGGAYELADKKISKYPGLGI